MNLSNRSVPLWWGACVLGAWMWIGYVPMASAQTRCPVERVCPTSCCAAGMICYQQACVPASAACTKNADCAAGQFCALSLGQCIATHTTNATCTYRPPIGQFSPSLLWEWKGGTVMPTFQQVMMTPVVMALQDDNQDGVIDVKDTPSVIFISHVGGGSHAEEGIVRAVRGDNGKDIFTVTDSRYRVNGLGSLAVGDIDNDGKPDIIAPRYAGKNISAGGVYAFDNTGAFKWVAKTASGAIAPLEIGWGGASIADIDGDGKPEVIVGSAVIRGSDGLVLCQGVVGAGANDRKRPLSVVVDLDGDGKQEIVAGSHAFRHDCSVMWSNNQADGYPAVADLNGNGKPEIAVVSGSTLRVQDGLTGTVLLSVAIAGGGGGPPTIGDFNGDGKPDIALAGSNNYIVYTPNFTTKVLTPLWSYVTQDFSSGRTGSSIFDFEGDGKAEAVYNDERFMRVFNGTSGTVLFSSPNISSTSLEYPVIVDVNNDGRAEIVVSSNHGTMANIRVFRDQLDNWVDTRNIWNQHAYHVTNICTGPTDPFCPPGTKFGQVPAKPLQHWKVAGLNNFRQNVQGKGLFEAADLLLRDIRASWLGCTNQVEIGVWIFNQGAKQIPKEIPVTIYQGTAAAKTKLLTIKTTRSLQPGEGEWLKATLTIATASPQSLYIAVDDDGAGQSTRNECDETNNHLAFPLPSAKGIEICDGKDNNCDGKVDETWPTLGQSCTAGVGACQTTGTVRCKADGSDVECTASPGQPVPEICDGKDNDCDGQIDETLRRPCSTTCGTGEELCQNGQWGQCSAPSPKPEACNNLDDDCDGQIDNGIPSRACKTTCGAGNETCQRGQWLCDATQPQPEQCNGKDDDCNGQIDDGIKPITCNGPCGQGQAQCVGGRFQGCSGRQPEPEVCDGKDNDCNGLIDDQVTRNCRNDCGRGLEICRGGTWGECSAPLPQPELCDGKDNNCDGNIDEGAKCPAGALCLEGQCKRKCRDGECPAGAICKTQPNGESLCEGDLCQKVTCPADKQCLAGLCTDLCDLVSCPQDNVCIKGLCVKNDCYVKGCPQGTTCIEGNCQTDPCANITCQANQFCRPDDTGKGQCVDTCASVTCNKEERCVDGKCQPDPTTSGPCKDVTCKDGERCDAGVCLPDPCKDLTCPPGRICIAGLCSHDPCANIKCPQAQQCTAGQCINGQQPTETNTEPNPTENDPIHTDEQKAPDASGESNAPDNQNKSTGQDNASASDNDRYATGCGCHSSPQLPFSLTLLLLGVCFLRRNTRHN